MKYLHFEDWSDPMFLSHVEKNGLPHIGKIIKVFASDRRPDERFGKPGLAVVESSGDPFTTDERFDYGENGVFAGMDLEERLSSFGID